MKTWNDAVLSRIYWMKIWGFPVWYIALRFKTNESSIKAASRFFQLKCKGRRFSKASRTKELVLIEERLHPAGILNGEEIEHRHIGSMIVFFIRAPGPTALFEMHRRWVLQVPGGIDFYRYYLSVFTYAFSVCKKRGDDRIWESSWDTLRLRMLIG